MSVGRWKEKSDDLQIKVLSPFLVMTTFSKICFEIKTFKNSLMVVCVCVAMTTEGAILYRLSLINWLILMAYQPVWSHLGQEVKESHSYLQF